MVPSPLLASRSCQLPHRSLPGLGMGLVVNLHQPVDVDVGVLLGGGEGGVTEQFLDGPQVRPPSRRWVAKVWRRVWGETFFRVATRRMCRSTTRRTLRLVSRPPRALRKRVPPAADRPAPSGRRPVPAGLATHRHDPLLPPLPRTRTNPWARSTPPTSRPVSSDTRTPQE